MDGKSTARFTMYFKPEKLQRIKLLAGILGKRPTEMIHDLIEQFLDDNAEMVDAVIETRAKFRQEKKPQAGAY